MARRRGSLRHGHWSRRRAGRARPSPPLRPCAVSPGSPPGWSPPAAPRHRHPRQGCPAAAAARCRAAPASAGPGVQGGMQGGGARERGGGPGVQGGVQGGGGARGLGGCHAKGARARCPAAPVSSGPWRSGCPGRSRGGEAQGRCPPGRRWRRRLGSRRPPTRPRGCLQGQAGHSSDSSAQLSTAPRIESYSHICMWCGQRVAQHAQAVPLPAQGFEVQLLFSLSLPLAESSRSHSPYVPHPGTHSKPTPPHLPPPPLRRLLGQQSSWRGAP